VRYPALFVVGALLANPALALRCGSDLVSKGDSTFALTQRCGPPTAVQRVEGRTVTSQVWDPNWNQYRNVVESVSDPYEIWYYNFGPTNFVAKITVRNGQIDKLEDDGYGY
jgi:hypothetical protein